MIQNARFLKRYFYHSLDSALKAADSVPQVSEIPYGQAYTLQSCHTQVLPAAKQSRRCWAKVPGWHLRSDPCHSGRLQGMNLPGSKSYQKTKQCWEDGRGSVHCFSPCLYNLEGRNGFFAYLTYCLNGLELNSKQGEIVKRSTKTPTNLCLRKSSLHLFLMHPRDSKLEKTTDISRFYVSLSIISLTHNCSNDVNVCEKFPQTNGKTHK